MTEVKKKDALAAEPSPPKDIIGEECPICHSEAFQLVPRVATVEVKCCPRCAGRIDLESEEKTTQEAIKNMEKSERRQHLLGLSYKWAEGLHGKKVLVFWDENTNLVFSDTRSKYSICGTAYKTTNTGGGWGQVKVVIDKSEHNRITVGCHHTLYCEIAKQDMFFASDPLPCKLERCQHQVFIVDRIRWCLPIAKGVDGEYFTTVTWGCKKALMEVGG